MLTITGPGPTWTSSEPSKRNPRWKPSTKAYAAFSRAVAARYRDQVDRYLIWNEPNQQGWLQPQWDCDSRGATARRSRRTSTAGWCARPCRRSARPTRARRSSRVSWRRSATTRSRRTRRSSRCRSCARWRAWTSATGRSPPACRGFKAAQADSFGYHPHPLLLAPDKPNPDTDEAQFADIKRLFTVLDRLRAKRRLRIGRTFHLTEFGYQTSPPDPAVGIALTLQTRYLQQAAYMAWKYKRVSGLSFYQWDDEPVVNRGSGTKRYSGWQTGLRFNNGTAEAGALDDAGAVRDRPSARALVRACSGARSARTPSRRWRC